MLEFSILFVTKWKGKTLRIAEIFNLSIQSQTHLSICYLNSRIVPCANWDEKIINCFQEGIKKWEWI